ncbi:hypothetical protein MF271_03275 [Deinococcus sp. KNUC1210]|uniref:hypothetical protein n=1 Tax=Deinococcus sp. KNUC1210 TaxID=2917691 RepID=UPI001EF03820|nr:hypothetical protein [Deinococcus sp. KNUC1210]ULH15676.1 hypothetical protein MF271_03275 [Deinococcus sp. KNUC1210]
MNASPGSARSTPQRPTQPLNGRPAGYQQLESYSSLKKFWNYLDAAERAGRRITLVRGDTIATCRRRLSGYRIPNAGGLIDEARVLAQLEDSLTPHPALIALLSGDGGPLKTLLSEGYELNLEFVVGLTVARDLIVRPELRYRPSEFVPPADPLPDDLILVPRRFGRDELRLLLERACGLA